MPQGECRPGCRGRGPADTGGGNGVRLPRCWVWPPSARCSMNRLPDCPFRRRHAVRALLKMPHKNGRRASPSRLAPRFPPDGGLRFFCPPPAPRRTSAHAECDFYMFFSAAHTERDLLFFTLGTVKIYNPPSDRTFDFLLHVLFDSEKNQKLPPAENQGLGRSSG